MVDICKLLWFSKVKINKSAAIFPLILDLSLCCLRDVYTNMYICPWLSMTINQIRNLLFALFMIKPETYLTLNTLVI